MKIFVIGQCTLHWGRMEYGNIGNYYIIEPFFRELHRVFPEAEVVTTLQMSEEFCQKENVKVVPMELYYGWKDDDLDIALREFAIASIYSQTQKVIEKTPYIEEVISSDLVIDFSGDIWGDNANFLGKDRFLVGLLKDRTAQLLGIPTAMLAGSPGPFSDEELLPFVKEVYSSFNLITNREEISTQLLIDGGFDITKTKSLACPSFLFEAASDDVIAKFIANTPLANKEKPIFGFILCGWNMLEGPFDKWPRDNSEYSQFIKVIEYIVKEQKGTVCLMSHSNGFELPPDFKLIRGRDYPIVNQLYNLLDESIKKDVILLDGIYSPAETKGIIRQFDMLVSGRVHGAIAGLSQSVPTVIIDYGHEPKAHKLRGFSRIVDMEEYIANPESIDDILQKVEKCWSNKDAIHKHLKSKNIQVKLQAKQNFDLLKPLIQEK